MEELVDQFIRLSGEDGDNSSDTKCDSVARELSTGECVVIPYYFSSDSEIENDNATLVGLVQLLGSYLTDEDGEARARATRCLSSVLKGLSSSKLTRQQLTVVTGFLSERLIDDESIIYVLEGLSALVSMVAFSLANVDPLVGSLDEHVDMKKLLQPVRFQVYSLLEAILNRFPGTSFPQMSHPNLQHKVALTYIKLTSGEKDPRNLLASFAISRRILTTFDKAVLTQDQIPQELFDVVFCYFPITFEPPKNDTYGITSKDLKDGLLNCLTANDVFASEAFPGLIEKLNSSSPVVKLDSLRTIKSCIQSYSSSTVATHWGDIWDGIKFEVLHGSDEAETSEMSLQVLVELGKALFRAKHASQLDDENDHIHEPDHEHEVGQPVLDNYLYQVKEEVKEKISEPQSKLALPAATLIAGIAQSSVKAFESLSSFAVPLILEILAQPASLERRTGAVTILIKFLTASSKLDSASDGSLLAEYQEEIFAVLSKFLLGASASESKLRSLAMEGLTLVTDLSGLAAQDEVGLVIQYLDTIVISDEDEHIAAKALESLKHIAQSHLELILNISFPALLAELPDVDTTVETTSAEVASAGKIRKSTDYILSAIASITLVRKSLEVLGVRLLSKLDVVVAQESGLRYPLSIIATLLKALRQVPVADVASFGLEAKTNRVISQLLSKIIQASGDSPLRQNEFIDVAANIISDFVRAVSGPEPEKKKGLQLQSPLIPETSETQASFAVQLVNLFVTGAPAKLCSHPAPLFGDGSMPSNLAALFVAGLAPLSKEIPLDSLVDCHSLVERSIDMLSQTSNVYERAAYLRIVAIVVNKVLAPGDEQLSDLTTQLLSSISDDSQVESLTVLEALTWIAKGLVIKSSPLGFKLTESIVDLLDTGFGKYAARMVAILVASDSVINKENHVVIRQLYKQKLFGQILPKVVTGFKQGGPSRVNHIVALSGLLQFTPSSIILPELPKFLPLLLESLEIHEPGVQEAAISTIVVTVHEAANVFAPHISTLVPKLLGLAQNRVNTPVVRSAALTCLQAFPVTIEMSVLLPYRAQVISGLTRVLDDPKRAVRHDAVVCRQAYFELR